MSLKAKVMVVAMVDGERREFQPGETLPELHAHDVASLKAMGAIEDDAEAAAAEKVAKAAEKASAAEFEAARKSVQSASASTGDAPASGGKKKAASPPAA